MFKTVAPREGRVSRNNGQAIPPSHFTVAPREGRVSRNMFLGRLKRG